MRQASSVRRRPTLTNIARLKMSQSVSHTCSGRSDERLIEGEMRTRCRFEYRREIWQVRVCTLCDALDGYAHVVRDRGSASE